MRFQKIWWNPEEDVPTGLSNNCQVQRSVAGFALQDAKVEQNWDHPKSLRLRYN